MAEKIATRESYGNALAEFAPDYDFVVLDADLAAATKTGIFKKKYPERFFNCGIAGSLYTGTARRPKRIYIGPLYSRAALIAAFASTSSAGLITTIPGIERISAISSRHW